MIHLKLIVVFGVRYELQLIFFCIDNQLLQHCLMEMLPFPTEFHWYLGQKSVCVGLLLYYVRMQ